MRVTVDTAKCIGSGQCLLCAPEVFGQSEADGLVMLLEPAPPRELHERVREAAMFCPSGAISLEEGH